MATPATPLRAVFPLLADPSTYHPFTFDYASPTPLPDGGTVTLATWINIFRQSIPGFKHHALKNCGPGDEDRLEAQAADFEARFNAALDLLAGDPSADTGYAVGYVTVNCAALCRLRDRCLQAAGFGDIFEVVKKEENEKALLVLPSVLRELDAQEDPEARLELAVRGVFAGNIFDLGAAASEELFRSTGATFQATRGKLAARPWPIDDFDTLLLRMRGKAYYKAVIFVDNAGSDVVLGILPLAREFLKRGTAVVLAANESPTINDITAAELSALMPAVAALDEEVVGAAFASGRLTVLSTGSDLPVIDLCALSPSFCAACTDSDLVLLEGMGRSIETNLHAKFSCDVFNLGMIKHPEVAALLGGSIYDCICRFEPARGSEPLWRSLLPGAKPHIGAGDVRVSVVWPPCEAHLAEDDHATGLQDLLGEGPLWSAEEGALYWVDIHRPALHRLVLSTGTHTAASLPSWVGCIGLLGSSRVDDAAGKRKMPDSRQQLIAALDAGLVLVALPPPPSAPERGKLPPAEVTPLISVLDAALSEEVCMNDGKTDPQGRFWVGSTPRPGSSLQANAAPYRRVNGHELSGCYEVDTEAGKPPPGRLYCVCPSSSSGAGTVTVREVEEVGPVTVSNGLGWSPDGCTMYYTDSPRRCVDAFDFDAKSGRLSGRHIFCTVPSSLPGDAVPDGLTVDADGSVWVAFWGGGAVGCFSAATGSLSRLISLPVSRPTCVTFGGGALDTLFVTSCRQDKGEAADLSTSGEPLAGCVFALRGTGCKGLPTAHFRP